MAFLTPLFLVGLAALAILVLVHLIQRERKRVIEFPSLIWYQTGYSTHVLRQASARARRPTQTKPCKVFFLYYAGTIQETALALMGEQGGWPLTIFLTPEREPFWGHDRIAVLEQRLIEAGLSLPR